MTLHDLTPFVDALQAGGYKRETNPLARGRAEQQWWKGVWTAGREYRDYTVCFRIYDRSDLRGFDVVRHGRWGVEYQMTVNHQTTVQVDLITVEVLHEDMSIEQWEGRCAVLFPAMEKGFKT